jgi:hypothetical protein
MRKREKEMMERNIELSAEFSRYLFDHPDFEKSIPSDAEIIFLPEFDSELKSFNLGLGEEIEGAGKKVVYVKIERIRPKIISRIEGVSLNVHASA